ncbi:hypothetical protein [Glycomyces salinus]|uniref:hypothetical protein n=1 Tax=Glycomyces salinus TaxID=980294 RepID=UPI0018ECF3A3|nr:hypothetical protein [Glycomyces salinus]
MYRMLSCWIYNGIAFSITISIFAIIRQLSGNLEFLYQGLIFVACATVAVVSGGAIYAKLSSRLQFLTPLTANEAKYKSFVTRKLSESYTFLNAQGFEYILSVIASMASAILMAAAFIAVANGEIAMGLTIEFGGIVAGVIVMYIPARWKSKHHGNDHV